MVVENDVVISNRRQESSEEEAKPLIITYTKGLTRRGECENEPRNIFRPDIGDEIKIKGWGHCNNNICIKASPNAD